MKRSISCVVHACDNYELLFPAFEYFFKKHFPTKIGLNYYFLTEVVDFQSQLFTNIKTGKGEWSERLKRGLKQIESDYIIYLQEDMWFDRPVDLHTLNQIAEWTFENDPDLVKLHSSPFYISTATEIRFNGFQLGKIDQMRSEYLMSHQVSLWNKNILLENIRKIENPWENEHYGTKRMRKRKYSIYQIDLISYYDAKGHVNNDNDDSVIPGFYNAISRNGKLSILAKDHIDHLLGQEEMEKYAEKLKYHYENNLKHSQTKPLRLSSRIARKIVTKSVNLFK